MNYILQKLGLAGTTSVVLAETLQLDTLWNALITLAVSVASVLAVEGVAWLKKFLQKKIQEIKLKKDNEQNEQ